MGVHIDGGMQEYISVPSYLLVHGEELSSDHLAMIEPLAIGAHGIARADIKPVNLCLLLVQVP
jgi:threonine dehydrogenase-like Zn-dependent dehydrogenase